MERKRKRNDTQQYKRTQTRIQQTTTKPTQIPSKFQQANEDDENEPIPNNANQHKHTTNNKQQDNNNDL